MKHYLLLLLPFAACSKKSGPEPAPAVYTHAQLVGEWKITSMTTSEPYAYNGGMTTDFMESATRFRQNHYSLHADSSAVINSSGGLVDYHARWKLVNNSFMWAPDGSYTAYWSEPIIAVTPSSFSTRANYPLYNGQPAVVTSVYTRQ
ncbi:MAG: hypothetical protein EOO11_17280 [Chitinophagaceae bacterium]|nr:MAG: hypothetical protein EOO11_17280 [Chitinophagaceae bacterium]